MSTIAEIQEAIQKLPANEKSALAVWLQSQEEPMISEAEEKALLARLDKAAAELDAGKGIPLARASGKNPWMGWKIIFAFEALEQIVRFIGQDDPQAAIRFGD